MNPTANLSVVLHPRVFYFSLTWSAERAIRLSAMQVLIVVGIRPSSESPLGLHLAAYSGPLSSVSGPPACFAHWRDSSQKAQTADLIGTAQGSPHNTIDISYRSFGLQHPGARRSKILSELSSELWGLEGSRIWRVSAPAAQQELSSLRNDWLSSDEATSIVGEQAVPVVEYVLQFLVMSFGTLPRLAR